MDVCTRHATHIHSCFPKGRAPFLGGAGSTQGGLEYFGVYIEVRQFMETTMSSDGYSDVVVNHEVYIEA